MTILVTGGVLVSTSLGKKGTTISIMGRLAQLVLLGLYQKLPSRLIPAPRMSSIQDYGSLCTWGGGVIDFWWMMIGDQPWYFFGHLQKFLEFEFDS
jgi:hypothetical protein